MPYRLKGNCVQVKRPGEGWSDVKCHERHEDAAAHFRALVVNVEEAKSMELQGTVQKVDEEQRLVFGWAYVAKKDGADVVDHSGDVVGQAALEDLELASRVNQVGEIGYLPNLKVKTTDRRFRHRLGSFLEDFIPIYLSVAILKKPSRNGYPNIRKYPRTASGAGLFLFSRKLTLLQNRHTGSLRFHHLVAGRNRIQRSGANVAGKVVNPLLLAATQIDIFVVQVISYTFSVFVGKSHLYLTSSEQNRCTR